MENTGRLRTFLRVAELGSFTKAGESLGIPKTSVSLHIQSLENELGARLFHRTTRSVTLTHDGSLLMERAKDLLSDIDELGNLFRSDPRDLVGRIRVDMSSRTARLVVIPRLPEFFARHPHLQVELGCTDREVDLVREGYDCVIRAGGLKDSSLVARKIVDMEIITCASPAYLKRHGAIKKPSDLKNHYLVQYVPDFGEAETYDYLDGDRLQSVRMKSMITVNNAEAYTAACAAGLGLIQVPVYGGGAEYLKREGLVEVLPKYKIGTMPVHLLYPNRRNLPKRVSVFMDWVGDILTGRAGLS